MRCLIPLVACHACLWSGLAAAQQGGAPPATETGQPLPDPATESPSQRVEDVELSITLLPDENGFQKVLNFSFNDFVEIYQLWQRREQPEQTPRYILQSMRATGTAKADSAELTVRFEVRIGDEHWTRVPLRLDQAVLLPEGRQYQGTGEYALRFEEGGQGYVAWIRGDPEQTHVLTLTVLVPLSGLGDARRLQLFAPAATDSELKLTVPLADAVGEVSDGGTLRSSSGQGEGTEFTVVGLGGDFELTWHSADSRPAEMPAALEAKGAILVKLDRRSVTTEATLTVTGQGGTIHAFRVALPEGAELLSSKAAGYSVSTVPDDDGAPGETLVEVRRSEPVQPAETPPEPAVVRLTTRQARGIAGTAGWFELAGFEVIDAVQQSGHVAVATVGAGQVRCAPGRGVRQVERVPESFQTTLQNVNVVAAFEYFSQPYSLAARAAEVNTRTRVEPKYRLFIEEDQVRLEADLKYAVRGAKAFAFEVELPGWELDEVGPENVVDVDAAAPSEVLSIPLLQPSTEPVEISIRAHQTIQPDRASLALELPRPHADSVGPAEVAVLPAYNVELTPDPAKMAGLDRQQVAPGINLPQWQQAPLFYRGETTRLRFAADFRTHDQTIAVDVTSTVRLAEGEVAVEQALEYEIAYVPLDELTIELPRTLSESNGLEVLLGGQRLSPVPPSGETNRADTSAAIRMRVVPPVPQLGRCELQVRYAIKAEELPRDASVDRPIPLVMPGQGKLSSNVLYVTAPQGIEVDVRGDGPWSLADHGTRSLQRHNALELAAGEWAAEAVLRLRRAARESTVVQRAWLQTRLTPTERFERAVLRFTSDRQTLELTLPPGVDRERIQLFLGPESVGDRREVEPEWTQDRLVIPLSTESGDRPQWLEVVYQFSDERPPPGRLAIRLPSLGDDVWVRRMYWQLLLPRNEHLIAGPHNLTPEYQWAWSGLFWSRKPIKDPSELEAWSGADPRIPTHGGANGYLFGSLGPVDRCELRTASRWSIVLGASMVALAAGLALIYVPASRHPAALLIAAVVLIGAALVDPEPALLAAQAASLGLALALLAGLLYRTVGRGRPRTAPRESSSSIFERGSTQARPQAPVAANPPSTETAPAAMPMPAPDSNP